MALPLFSFDTSKGETPETLKQRRSIAQAMLSGRKRPTSIPEGITDIGDAILYRSMMNQAADAEKAGRASAGGAMSEATTGWDTPAAPVAAPAVAPPPVAQPPVDMTFGGDTLMPPGASVEMLPQAPPAAVPPVQPVPSVPTAQPAATNTRASSIPPEIRDGIAATAAARGISPVDLATAISYETGGTFDPTQRGPTTKWGQHKGLIQFGEPQAKQYGVDWNNPVGSQLGPDGAVSKYLAATGVQPGMGLKDIYSAINAGGVGRYDRSDAAAGGAPGTVADKVNSQMEGHKRIAQAMFAAQGGAPQAAAQAPTQVASLDPSAGLTPEAPQPPQGNVTRVAQAVQGGQNYRLNVPQQQAQAPMPITPQAQPQQQPAGPSMQKLIEISQNPWLSDGQRSVVNMLLKERLEQQDPKRQLEIKKLQSDIERGGKPTSALEYEYGQRTPGFFENQERLKRAGAQNITLDQRGDNAFSKTGHEALSKQYVDVVQSGRDAQAMVSDVHALREIGARIKTGKSAEIQAAIGPYAESLGIKIDGLDDMQAYKAIVSKMAPRMRVPGSGSSSDIDVRMFLEALPGLGKTAGGNEMIANTLEAMAQHKIAAGEIASRALVGEITPRDAEKEMRALPDPLTLWKKQGKTLSPTGTTKSGLNWSVE